MICPNVKILVIYVKISEIYVKILEIYVKILVDLCCMS